MAGTEAGQVDLQLVGERQPDLGAQDGLCQPGVGELVSWFNPERQLVQDIVVTANGWRSQSTLRLPQGGYWVRFRQVIGTGGDSIQSDWADSRRFEVVPALRGITQTDTEADGR